MKVLMDYGRSGMTINVPDDADVYTTRPIMGLSDEENAIKSALKFPIQSPPLSKLIKPGMKVVVTHTDITRATPNARLLPVILRELESYGVGKEDVTLLNALGTHRPQTNKELRQMLGNEIVDQYQCIQHDAFDDEKLVRAGTTHFGHEIRLNQLLLQADFVIFTGFIEPHFFAGFSGGPKAVLPALAGAESVYTNHSHAMIAHPNATFNVTEGNPIWEEMREATRMLPATFLVNVTLNRAGEISGVYAGDVIAAQAKGIQVLQETSLKQISAPFDVVITSNSGYPLDQNLYQSVKGIAAARKAVRKDGAILLLAACEQGIPPNSAYERIFAEGLTLSALSTKLAQAEFVYQDTWQVQIQLDIQKHADCYVFSTGLSDDQIKHCMFNPVKNIEETISQLTDHYGKRVCVLPEGPLIMIKQICNQSS